MANPAHAYLATQIETTSQGELLVMLYEAAIKFLKRAKIEIERKDYAKKGIYISKAMAIIHELVESLNREKGGQITPTLLSLYQFCTSQLVQANIRLDTKRIDDVIKILDGIRSAYAQIVTQDAGQVSATAPAQALPKIPAAPQAPPIAPGVGPQSMAYSAPRPTVAPAGEQTGKPAETQPAPAAKPAQAAAPKPQEATKPPAKPAPQSPPTPPKLRSAFNAAKFRAANAYSNNNT